MNPFYEPGTMCAGPACEPCKKKHDNCHECSTCGGNGCDKCKKPTCACPEPFLAIDKVPTKDATYRINDNGKTALWDIKPAIIKGQTDTSISINSVLRVLQYFAERHTDTITAQELGSMLHLNDLGDVSTKGAEDGAMMVFKKNDTCPTGCYGTSNIWEPWNALDEQTSSVTYGYGFNAQGQPATLQQPTNTSQYYNLGWNGNNQLSYTQPVESDYRLDSGGYYYQLCLDPNTKQTYYKKVKAN